MKKPLLIFFLLLPALAQAKVKIFGSKIIEENTALLVKSSSIRDLKACLWLNDNDENFSVCKDLYVRVNQDRTRAKIYLPSVDKDIQAKLLVTSGPYESDEQEFLISIKNVIDPKKDFMSHFKFFTKKKKQDYYTLSVKRNDDHEDYHQHRQLSPDMYKAQKLTFQLKEKIRQRRKKRAKDKKPKFRDLFSLKPRHIPPLDPSLGDIFVSDTQALCIFMDNTWLKIVGSGQCIPKDSSAFQHVLDSCYKISSYWNR